MNKLKQIKPKYIFIALALVLFAHGYHLTAKFFETHVLQFPVIMEWQGIIGEKYVSPVPSDIKATPIERATEETEAMELTPTPTPKKKALKIDLVREVEASEIEIADFDKIRILESGKGTAPVGHHRYCEGLGMWNEIGYGNRQGICFESMAEGKVTLEKWYAKRASEGMSLAEALCYWEGQGKGVSSCVYSQRYFAL